MSDRRNRPPNRWGCKPTEDVCVEHDVPLECRHGCRCAKPHACNDRAQRLAEKLGKAAPVDLDRLERLRAEATPRHRQRRADVKPIPIRAAKAIADLYGYDQVIVIARKVGEGEHCTTYGVDKENCEVAARCGDFLKFKVMGWAKGTP